MTLLYAVAAPIVALMSMPLSFLPLAFYITSNSHGANWTASQAQHVQYARKLALIPKRPSNHLRSRSMGCNTCSFAKNEGLHIVSFLYEEHLSYKVSVDTCMHQIG